MEKSFSYKFCFFKNIAEFEADNTIDNSSTGKETTKYYKQNALCNGNYISSEFEDVLKSGYYSSFLDYENVDWFVEEVKKLEK